MAWPTRIVRQKTECGRALCFALLSAVAVYASACAAASRPPDASGPRAPGEPVYATLTESATRREVALGAWANLARSQGISNAPPPELQPVTSTIKAIPPLNPPLYLPKVGAAPVMTEEETREALRRFITDQITLIGAEPKQLSLVLRTDLADGTKRAKYEQHPFRYPLRGGYGQLEITFTPDRRVLQIISTCIPEVEQLQKTLATAIPKLNAEQVAANITGRQFTYTDALGNQQTQTVVAGDEVNVRELVIYPLARAGDPTALELHLAWEVLVGSGPSARVIYLDALANKIIAANTSG